MKYTLATSNTNSHPRKQWGFQSSTNLGLRDSYQLNRWFNAVFPLARDRNSGSWLCRSPACRRMPRATAPPFAPVGWSTCGLRPWNWCHSWEPKGSLQMSSLITLRWIHVRPLGWKNRNRKRTTKIWCWRLKRSSGCNPPRKWDSVDRKVHKNHMRAMCLWENLWKQTVGRDRT